MSEKDLDIAIEKCERIMEFDTRTLKNPESENGYIFEMVYDLLRFLRQFQFATDTNVPTTDTISRQAAINAICEDGTRIERQGRYSMTMVERKQRDVDILKNLPSAQPGWIPCKTALPEKRKYVLCQCRAGIMDVLRLTDDNGWYKDSTHIYMHGFVLAWMPLPEPWKGGQDE